MIFTAFSYGKMAGAFPKAGSTYNYTSQAIHPNLGFMAGWAILLDYLFLPILLYKLSAIFAMELLPFVPFWLMLFAFVIPVTLSNILGAKTTSRVNMAMTALMLLSLVLFIVFAIKAVHEMAVSVSEKFWRWRGFTTQTRFPCRPSFQERRLRSSPTLALTQ